MKYVRGFLTNAVVGGVLVLLPIYLAVLDTSPRLDRLWPAKKGLGTATIPALRLQLVF